MKLGWISVAAIGALLLAGGVLAQGPAPVTLNFDADAAGQPPPGFEFGRTGNGAQTGPYASSK